MNSHRLLLDQPFFPYPLNVEERAGNLLGLGESESPASYPYGHPKFSLLS